MGNIMSSRIELPCKTCILLAMCKSRENIRCQLLEEYILNKKDGISISDIREILPRFKGVFIYEGRPNMRDVLEVL